jgi:hypothetical protein
VVRPHFFLSFYFWLDTVAVLSLAFELPALRAVLLLGATQVGQEGSCCSTRQHLGWAGFSLAAAVCLQTVAAVCKSAAAGVDQQQTANHPSEMRVSPLFKMHAGY